MALPGGGWAQMAQVVQNVPILLLATMAQAAQNVPILLLATMAQAAQTAQTGWALPVESSGYQSQNYRPDGKAKNHSYPRKSGLLALAVGRSAA